MNLVLLLLDDNTRQKPVPAICSLSHNTTFEKISERFSSDLLRGDGISEGQLISEMTHIIFHSISTTTATRTEIT